MQFENLIEAQKAHCKRQHIPSNAHLQNISEYQAMYSIYSFLYYFEFPGNIITIMEN